MLCALLLLSVNAVDPSLPLQCSSRLTLSKCASPATADYPTVKLTSSTVFPATIASVFSTSFPATATDPD